MKPHAFIAAIAMFVAGAPAQVMASSVYPEVVQRTLGMPCEPQCLLIITYNFIE